MNIDLFSGFNDDEFQLKKPDNLFKINTPIRLIELFAGYGSQALALKYLGANFTSHKVCEWEVDAIISYAETHYDNFNEFKFSDDMDNDALNSTLHELCISSDGKKPLTFDQIKRLSRDKKIRCLNAIQISDNLVDITQVNGVDLDITDTDAFTYLLTYSFPCQDLSLAGKGAGMTEGSDTRSNMIWQVGRILDELKNSNRELPQVLLMENVTQVVGKKNINDFNLWLSRLEKLGYSNFYQNMIATEYGVVDYDPVPQTRDRTFMVSVLGDYKYDFPKKMELKHLLKDFLEDTVDEKYFLSEDMIKYVCSRMPSGENKITTGMNISTNGDALAGTITCGEGGKPSSNYVIENDDFSYDKKVGGIVVTKAAKKLNKLVNESNNSDVGVVVKPKVDKLGYYHPSCHNASAILNPDGLAPTVMENHGTINAVAVPKVVAGIGEMKSNGGTQWYNQDRIYDDNISPALATTAHPYHLTDLRIRKLTPTECFRLMGVKDEDSNKLTCSNSRKFKLAGNSIVVNVMMAIFKEMI